jgi:hypothetical protein
LSSVSPREGRRQTITCSGAAWQSRIRIFHLGALRCGYQGARNRLRRLVIDGHVGEMRALLPRGVLYYPYVEPVAGAGKRLLKAPMGLELLQRHLLVPGTLRLAVGT